MSKASSLVLATRSPHKLRELGRLLASAGIAVEPLPAGIALPPEDGATFAENYRTLTGKATAYADLRAAVTGITITSDNPF